MEAEGGKGDAHFAIDFDLLRATLIVGADLLTRRFNGRELADGEVLFRLRADFARLVLRLLVDEGDELLNLLLHLRVIHDDDDVRGAESRSVSLELKRFGKVGTAETSNKFTSQGAYSPYTEKN